MAHKFKITAAANEQFKFAFVYNAETIFWSENYKQKAIAGDAKATAHLYNYYMYQVNDTNASVKVLTMGAERNLANFQMELASHFTSEGNTEEAAKWLSRFEDNPTSAGLLTSRWYSDLYSRLRSDVADGL